jgi:hypothetical protein
MVDNEKESGESITRLEREIEALKKIKSDREHQGSGDKNKEPEEDKSGALKMVEAFVEIVAEAIKNVFTRQDVDESETKINKEMAILAKGMSPDEIQKEIDLKREQIDEMKNNASNAKSGGKEDGSDTKDTGDKKKNGNEKESKDGDIKNKQTHGFAKDFTESIDLEGVSSIEEVDQDSVAPPKTPELATSQEVSRG